MTLVLMGTVSYMDRSSYVAKDSCSQMLRTTVQMQHQLAVSHYIVESDLGRNLGTSHALTLGPCYPAQGLSNALNVISGGMGRNT